ncbi:MAG TPA: class II aldolase/adducin family protein [Candidatus Acidoferrales bacterium]|jgi:L-fuculose-phosphate aldolase|nr:class II aldolase/adducin family protein [Candidatus Acidoferrales bacterium]
MKAVDLQERVITLGDVEAAVRDGATELVVGETAILTPSAREAVELRRLTVRIGSAPAAGAPGSVEALFHCAEAQAAKEEICAVGKKLWLRQYVDGNGGNISYRIGPNEVICTPTLTSKYDLKPDEMCMVDLTGKQLAGGKPRTSEILMHLEIYKEVPEAKGVVHCHPPHATAYAITGRVPPNCIIPEYEVFIGKVALSPYETPGSQKFAETVIPYVKTHNTVLLANHGIVCWGDTVTHAEWYAEVVDTYCWTLMLAAQLGSPISHITSDKAADLVAIKKSLGLPDPRHDSAADCEMCDLPPTPGAIAMPPKLCGTTAGATLGAISRDEVEQMVRTITAEVLARVSGTGGKG